MCSLGMLGIWFKNTQTTCVSWYFSSNIYRRLNNNSSYFISHTTSLQAAVLCLWSRTILFLNKIVKYVCCYPYGPPHHCELWQIFAYKCPFLPSHPALRCWLFCRLWITLNPRRYIRRHQTESKERVVWLTWVGNSAVKLTCCVSLLPASFFRYFRGNKQTNKKPWASWKLLNACPVRREGRPFTGGTMAPCRTWGISGIKEHWRDERHVRPSLVLFACTGSYLLQRSKGEESSRALEQECAQQWGSCCSRKLVFGLNNSLWQRWKLIQLLRVMGWLQSLLVGIFVLEGRSEENPGKKKFSGSFAPLSYLPPSCLPLLTLCVVSLQRTWWPGSPPADIRVCCCLLQCDSEGLKSSLVLFTW